MIVLGVVKWIITCNGSSFIAKPPTFCRVSFKWVSSTLIKVRFKIIIKFLIQGIPVDELKNNVKFILVYDEAQREDAPRHKDLIRRNFMWLSENMDAESGLISLLYQQNVLTVRERESIFSIIDTFQKKEFLLGMLSKKSPEEFEKFLNALEDTGQGHLAKKLRKPAGRPTLYIHVQSCNCSART